MKIKKIAIVLEESDLIDLEAILLDEDEQAAFQFLRRLCKRIKVQQRQQCGSPLVKGESG
jgi:hypothetical protein